MVNKTDILKTPVRYLKGVGPKRSETLHRLGLNSIEDMLWYFPRRYEDRSQFKPISKLTIGQNETVKGAVLTLGLRRAKSGTNIFELAVGDKSGVIYAVWFNQPFLKRNFKVGDEIILYGKIEFYNKLQINSPEYEIISSKDKNYAIHMGRLVPIYSLTQQISQRYLRSLVYQAVTQYATNLKDMLPNEIKVRHKLIDLSLAVKNVHFPRDINSCLNSRFKLIFDEFFLLLLGLSIKKIQDKEEERGISFKLNGPLVEKFKKSLPFELTNAQKKVIAQIENDMAAPKVMNRLLQGDVGSGKTVVAAFALTLAVDSGYQGAIMAPTELLAEQHYLTLNKLLEPLGIKIVLLVSGLDKKKQELAYKEIESGAGQIVIGTQAIIQEKVNFKNLGLVVIDEQHKFGVIQRSTLREKGLSPDILVMTATPIPRTLALTVYGDLDISTIDELPPGRRAIKTILAEENKRSDIYEFIKKEVCRKRQAYIVYPLIEDSYKSDLKAAASMYESLAKGDFSKFKVGLVHGRLKKEPRDKIMGAFKEGKIDILVSTIVIEVGIDIPNATVMLIENAERFGLSQLHQLRGRIGRGSQESYCILLSQGQSEEAKARLLAMANTQDGFKIAEYDLALRGPGEFFGTRQHGLPELRVGNIISDLKILELAKEEVNNLLKKDRGLNEPRHFLIKETLRRRFKIEELELAKVS